MRYFKKVVLILPVFLFLIWMGSCTKQDDSSKTEEHVHTYASNWDYDEKSHWHNSNCEHKGLKDGIQSHQFDAWVSSEKENVEQRGCTICDYTETRTKTPEPHTHTYGEWMVEQAPTLTDSGKLKRVCSQDASHFEEFTLPQFNPKEYTYQVIKEATCMAKGEASYIYTKDKKQFSFSIVLDFADHTYGDWVMLQKPTEHEAGRLQRICSTNEAHIDTFELPILNETDYTYTVLPASCLEDGKKIYTFEKDAQAFVIELPIVASGHTYEMMFDAYKHWMGATCEHSSLKKEIADHIVEEGKCKVCHYEIKADDAVIYELNSSKNGYIASFHPGYTGNSISVLATYMDLPVVRIKASSFDGKDIASITLPASIACIEADAFKNFNGLENVYYDGTLSDWCHIEFKDKTSNPMHIASNFYQRKEGFWEETTKGILSSDVTVIGKYQFYGFGHMDEITLPENLVRIDEEAFADCTSIQELLIPQGVSTLGKNFLLNTALTKLTIPFLDYTNTYIGYYFGAMTRDFSTGTYLPNASLRALEELHITNTTYLGFSALSNLSNLRVLTLSNKIQELGNRVIYGCEALEFHEYQNGYYLGNDENPYFLFVKMKDSTASSFVISPEAKLIYESAFKDVLITELALPTSLVDIGYEAFSGSAIQSIVVPSGVKKIKQRTFYGCKNLEEVFLPKDLVNIEREAFTNTPIKKASLALEATSILTEVLEELNLLSGEGAIDLGRYPNLKKVILTNGISDIGSDIVSKCPSLEYTILNNIGYLGSETNPYLWLITAQDKTIENTTISFDTKYIYEQAFKDCTQLISISIPSGVTYIGNEAFMNATNLSYVSYLYNLSHSKLKVLGSSVFANCSSLYSLELPNELTQIGYGILSGCSNLNKVSVPFVGSNSNIENASYTTLFGYYFGRSAYTGGTNVEQRFLASNRESKTNYVIPKSLKEVEVRGGKLFSGTFSNCSMIEKITIFDEVECLSTQRGYLFYQCQFQEMTIPDTYIQHITRMTLSSEAQYNSGLSGYVEKLHITTGEEIASRAFQYFTNLQEVELANSIKSIHYGAFEYCSSLMEVKLPEQLEIIEQAAFRYCSALRTIDLPSSLKSIGSQALYSCGSLQYITLSSSIETIVSGAFDKSSDDFYIFVDAAEAPAGWGDLGVNEEQIHYSVLGVVEEANSLYYIKENRAYFARSIVAEPKEITISGEIEYDGVSYPVIIRKGILKNASSLEKLTIPFIGENKDAAALTDNINTIPFGYIFGAPSYETQSNYVPESLKTIGITSGTIIPMDAFYGLANVESIVLSDSLKEIRAYAFDGCSSLKSIQVPNQVTTIRGRVFNNCSSLEYIILPNSIVTLDNSAFSTTTSTSSSSYLKVSLYYEGTEEDWEKMPSLIKNNMKDVYFYSEQQQEGKYWHYVDDIPVLW